MLEKWLGPTKKGWEEEFDTIDMTNKKGAGNVLFKVRFEEIKILILICFRNSLNGQNTRTCSSREIWGSMNSPGLILNFKNSLLLSIFQCNLTSYMLFTYFSRSRLKQVVIFSILRMS